MNNKKLMAVAGVASIAGAAFGLGLATPRVTKWAIGNFSSTEKLVEEMRNHIIYCKDNKITFDQFTYYVSEQIEVMLKNAAFLQLTEADLSHYTRNLSPASQTILLSGPSGSELYLQTLAKALANFFHSDLLLLDVSSFKIRSKSGAASRDNKRSNSEATQRGSEIFGSVAIMSREEENAGTLHRQSSGVDASKGTEDSSSSPKLNASTSCDNKLSSQSMSSSAAPIKRITSWILNDKLLIKALYKVLSKASEGNPLILYLRDVEKFLCISERIHILFQKMLKKLKGPVLILGSRIVHTENNKDQVSEQIASVFSYQIEVRPPEDETRLVRWKTQLEEDMKTIQYEDIKDHLFEVLAANDIECDDLGSLCVTDTIALSNNIEEIVVSAICSHLTNNKNPEYRNGKLLIPARSFSKGLSVFQDHKSTGTDDDSKKDDPKKDDPKKDGPKKDETKKDETKKDETKKDESKKDESKKDDSKKDDTKKDDTKKNDLKKDDTKKDDTKKDDTKKNDPKKNDTKKNGGQPKVPADNEFEKCIRSEVIPCNKINVTFDDIGVLDDIKESLQELVMLPIRRPELFKGGILKPCKGLLLFGPPGTGKTMLAKAVAKEAGASFINITASVMTSKWYGEDEKLIQALFSIAAKVSPSIIFIDEVDSLLSARSSSDHECYRKFKNEFMVCWDGLMTDADQNILVLGATNRPFDLDDAVIRRFQRRIMVGLPTAKSRESIFRTLLEKKKGVDAGIDFKELATMTEGYTGSDLKNLCTTAAFRPVKEFIQKERLRELEENKDKSSEISKKEYQDKAAKSSDTSKEDKDKAKGSEVSDKDKGNAISSEVSKEATDKAISSDVSKEATDKAISSEVSNEATDKAKSNEVSEGAKEERVIDIRPLNMEDFKEAKKQVRASFPSRGFVMEELKRWNRRYAGGDEESKPEILTYFL